MRVMILVAAAVLAPVSVAQPVARVVIEDDVSHDNAIKCKALRASQLEAAAEARALPDPVRKGAHEAWDFYLGRQPGFDGQRTSAEVEARINSFKSSPAFHANPTAFLDSLENDCAAFEIRSAN